MKYTKKSLNTPKFEQEVKNNLGRPQKNWEGLIYMYDLITRHEDEIFS